MSLPSPGNSALSTQHSALRIGLFGGTFNPVHRCHLTIASQVRDCLSLDRILFIPTGDPPHKPDTVLAPATHRYEMVRLAIAGRSDFELSDIETTRPGKSYSIDTVRALQTHFGPNAELRFIIGLDAFLEFGSWREAHALLRICRFAVLFRGNASFQALASLPWFPPTDKRNLVGLDQGDRAQVEIDVPGGGLTLLRTPPCDVSASEIRARLRRREGTVDWLPPPVESYIIRHKLYQEDADHT
jgi:nicotinate-nucleotide adenylyltransferase